MCVKITTRMIPFILFSVVLLIVHYLSSSCHCVFLPFCSMLTFLKIVHQINTIEYHTLYTTAVLSQWLNVSVFKHTALFPLTSILSFNTLHFFNTNTYQHTHTLTSQHITPYHITLHHITSHHITLHHIKPRYQQSP